MIIDGAKLRQLRKQRKFSVQVLADKMGVSDAAICNWEASRHGTTSAHVKKLAEIFKVGSEDLIPGANPPPPSQTAVAYSDTAASKKRDEILECAMTGIENAINEAGGALYIGEWSVEFKFQKLQFVQSSKVISKSITGSGAQI